MGTTQHYGDPLTSTLKLDASRLGLGNPTDYVIHWAGSSETIYPSDWNSVSITLNGMADVLIITHK